MKKLIDLQFNMRNRKFNSFDTST
jgi:hypothetical protein